MVCQRPAHAGLSFQHPRDGKQLVAELGGIGARLQRRGQPFPGLGE
jgi:hypothetical protein